MSVEQGQLLRAAERDQCELKVKTHRWRDAVEFTHSLLGVNGNATDDSHRRRQDVRESGLDVASFDHCDISAEVGVFNKIEVPSFSEVRSGTVAALEGPKDVTENTVRVGCGRLDEWGSGVCVSRVQKRQQRSHC